jgi:ketosteroid isomerase-like protein
MTITGRTTGDTTPLASARQLADQLATVFRTAEVGDLFTDDLFFDGHPPFWRFQLEGLDSFRGWLADYAASRPEVTVLGVVPTMGGLVVETMTVERQAVGAVTARKLFLCSVRDGRISEMVVYCNGDWDEALHARHRAEAPVVRP